MSSEIEWFGQTLDPQLRSLELFGLADKHTGNQFSDQDGWENAILYIKNKPQARAILVGDLLDSVLRDSKGDVYSQTMNPQYQRDRITDDLRPIASKLLGATTGNHEDRIYERTGVDLTSDIAKALAIPYDPDGIFLRIAFGDRCHRKLGEPFVYWVYATHGYGGARTKAAKAVKVERTAQFVRCDVAMMAHDHDANIAPAEMLEPDEHHTRQENGWTKGNVKAHRTLLVKCSAFLKWGGHGRRKGFSPNTLIPPTVLLGGQDKPWPMPTHLRDKRCEVRGIL